MDLTREYLILGAREGTVGKLLYQICINLYLKISSLSSHLKFTTTSLSFLRPKPEINSINIIHIYDHDILNE